MDSAASRALRDPAAIAARQELATRSDHVAPLNDFTRELEYRGRVPSFDPTDAGINARVLFVLEAPGPMAGADRGSGFVSADNNDATAANCWTARSAAGLIDGVLMWNACPWYLGAATVKPSPLEVARGAAELRALIDLLPYLQTVVLCGSYAKTAWRTHVVHTFDNAPDAIETWHPSAASLSRPERRTHFMNAVARAAATAR